MVRCACHEKRLLGRGREGDAFGDAKIYDLNGPFGGYNDVLGAQVTMREIETVCHTQGIREGTGDVYGYGNGEGGDAMDALFQVGSARIFGDEKGTCGLQLNVVEGCNVRVRKRLRFLEADLQTLKKTGIGSTLRHYLLQGDDTVRFRIARFINGEERPFPYKLQQFVALNDR